MAKLPSASDLGILTHQNILAVSDIYLQQMSEGTCDDITRGQNFVKGALYRSTMKNIADESVIVRDGKLIDTLLQLIPHALVPPSETSGEGTETEIREWCIHHDVPAQFYWHRNKLLMIFNSHDDEILFKLKWL